MTASKSSMLWLNVILLLQLVALLIASADLMALAPIAPKYVLDREKSTLQFQASTSKFEVKGTFSKWDIIATASSDKITDIKIKAQIETASLDTGDRKRDQHLRTEDFFWSEKYPVAMFESTEIKELAKGRFQVEGRLNFRNFTKGIRFEATVDDKLQITGVIKLNRQDFGISYEPGIFVKIVSGSINDDVLVKFNLAVKRIE